MRDSRHVRFLVSAPNQDGRSFVKQLIRRELPYALLTNNKKEKSRLQRSKHAQLVQVKTAEPDTWRPPGLDADLIILFERSPALSWRYVQFCRTWTESPIHIFTCRGSFISKRREMDIQVHQHIAGIDPAYLDMKIDSFIGCVSGRADELWQEAYINEGIR
ncbi:hypothetical protein [Cohnella sp. 56]|uniref:hypothetical protein n=1 Tax=Cohnella sp. 56 TaxID=3113722 RepID=UPI0030E903B1